MKIKKKFWQCNFKIKKVQFMLTIKFNKFVKIMKDIYMKI